MAQQIEAELHRRDPADTLVPWRLRDPDAGGDGLYTDPVSDEVARTRLATIITALAAIATELADNLDEGGSVSVANFPAVQQVTDDYGELIPLEDQAGADAILTFDFTTDVHLVVVESSGDGLVSRAGGAAPDADTGVPCRHEVPTYMPFTTTELKVFAPAGTVVAVWGFRR